MSDIENLTALRDRLVTRRFDLGPPPGIRHGWRAPRGRHEHVVQIDSHHLFNGVGVPEGTQSDDIDWDEVTAVLLYAVAFFGLLLVIAFGTAAAIILSALLHW